jgi:hypothetical protein
VVFDGPHPWHTKEMAGFKEWLGRNGFALDDTQYNYGYHPVGQVDLRASFGTSDYREIWGRLSRYLDIQRISVSKPGNLVCSVYPYSYTDSDYYEQQINRLKPGYDFSSRG